MSARRPAIRADSPGGDSSSGGDSLDEGGADDGTYTLASLLRPPDGSAYAPILEATSDCLPHVAHASIVVDAITEYPTPPGEFRTALRSFLSFVRQTDCIGCLLAPAAVQPAAKQRVRLATELADMVIEYHRADTVDGDDALRVPKLRTPPHGADELPITVDLDVGRQLEGAAGDTF